MWEVFKDFTFEASHFLPNVPKDHKCKRLHGHSYQVTVYVTGEIGVESGWVVDYADISAAWKPLYEILDHHFINDVPGLRNSTSEHLAKWIYERMATAIPGVDRVTVRETATAGCTYRPPSASPSGASDGGEEK